MFYFNMSVVFHLISFTVVIIGIQEMLMSVVRIEQQLVSKMSYVSVMPL